jgi:hypothetical protein
MEKDLPTSVGTSDVLMGDQLELNLISCYALYRKLNDISGMVCLVKS